MIPIPPGMRVWLAAGHTDSRDGTSCRPQPRGFLVAIVAASMGVLAAALRRCHPTGGRFRGCLLCRWPRDWFVHLLGGAAEMTVVPIDDGPDGIAEIAQQVRAVRHLDRLRRALADPVGVGTSTVARDDLDPGMLPKPPC